MCKHLLINGEAVSVIIPVSSLIHAENVFSNYMRQDMAKKELILVHNNFSDDFEQWIRMSASYPMTRVYQLDPGASLGECLNYCIERAIFENISIFQELHHYAPEYLSASVNDMYLNATDLAGKKTYFLQNEREDHLTLANPGFEKCFVDTVILPTFVFKQSLFNSARSGVIRFIESNAELDTTFCKDCRNNGCRIYSTDASGFQYRCL